MHLPRQVPLPPHTHHSTPPADNCRSRNRLAGPGSKQESSMCPSPATFPCLHTHVPPPTPPPPANLGPPRTGSTCACARGSRRRTGGSRRHTVAGSTRETQASSTCGMRAGARAFQRLLGPCSFCNANVPVASLNLWPTRVSARVRLARKRPADRASPPISRRAGTSPLVRGDRRPRANRRPRRGAGRRCRPCPWCGRWLGPAKTHCSKHFGSGVSRSGAFARIDMAGIYAPQDDGAVLVHRYFHALEFIPFRLL